MATFMDSWTLEETLKVLSHSTGSSSTLYRLLTKIREVVEWPKHKENIVKLQKSGCLRYIIAALRSSHIHIVSLALSILGNACMDSKCSSEVVYNSGLTELNQVLKRYPQDNGVNGRVFRVIGNMCQHSMGGLILEMKSNIVSYIVKFVQKYAEEDLNNSVFSECTMEMAVRALRQLLNGQTFFPIVKTFKVLKSIGTLFIKCTNRWIEQKKDKHILDGLIKFLLHYSRYRYYPGIAELRNTPEGDSLIYLSKVLPLAPKKIVKIIMNLIRISQLKSDLPIPEICGGFVKLLREQPVAQDFKDEFRSYISCLCFLLEHPANRDSQRCRETIPQLIKLLDEFQDPTEKILESCILIVITLDKCGFHDQIVKEQIECNIIEILVRKIEWIIGNSKTIDKHKPQRKRKRKHSSDFSTSFKIGISYPELWNPKTPQSSDEEFEMSSAKTSMRINNRCSSPSSGSESDMAMSPWSSPGASPLPQRNHNYLMPLPYPDLSDSEDYSPVCSDEDEEEDSKTKPSKDEVDSNIEVQRLSDGDDENSDDNMKISAFSLKHRLLDQILTLLKTYSTIQPSLMELCSEKLIMALLKCCSYFDHNSMTASVAINLICRILHSHDYLIPLMQTDIVEVTHSLTKMTHGSNCIKCNQIKQIGQIVLGRFSGLAESGRGKGDIANRLILGSHEQKKQLVLSIPYIIRNKSILNSFMVNCGGLEILMELLLDLQFQEKSIQVLCALSVNTLGICNPQQWPGSQREKMVINDYRIAENCENVVTFVLDDNSCLSADRDFLCKKSCFFNSLLNGGFRESNETFVKLHHTDYIALKSLIHLLHCDFDKTEPKDVQLDTRTLLEVIMLCDRYLLEDLCVFLTECVQQFAMSAANVPIIYKWALESKTNILRVESIAYALVGENEDSTRLQMFTNLFNLGYSKEVVSDIRQLLMRYLSIRGLF